MPYFYNSPFRLFYFGKYDSWFIKIQSSNGTSNHNYNPNNVSHPFFVTTIQHLKETSLMKSTDSSILITLRNNGITTTHLNLRIPDLISFEPGITLQSYEMWKREKIVSIIALKMRQSDVCLKVLVTFFNMVNCRPSVSKKGRTSTYILLSYMLGVKQMIVAINKMDVMTVNYSKKRHNIIKTETGSFLKRTGFNLDKIPFPHLWLPQ